MNFLKKFIGLISSQKKNNSEVNPEYSGTSIRQSHEDVLSIIEVDEFEFKSDPIKVLKKCFPYEYWRSPEVMDWLVDGDNSLESYEQFFKDVHIDFDRANREISIIDIEKFQFGGHWLVFKYTIKDGRMFIFYWGLEG